MGDDAGLGAGLDSGLGSPLGFDLVLGSSFRCGPRFGAIQNPISDQLDAVIDQRPSKSIDPHERCPFPGDGSHENPKNCDQRRHGLRADHRSPQIFAGGMDQNGPRVRVRKIVRCPATDNFKYISVWMCARSSRGRKLLRRFFSPR